MDEIDRLVKAVELLKESMEIMLQRAEQLFKLQEAQVAVLPQLAEMLKQTQDNLEVTDEALKQALDQLDGNSDDLAKVTAALLTIQQQANQEEQSGG